MNQIFTNKTYQLIAGSLVLLLVSYQLAFKETLNSWQINRQLTEQVEGMDNLSDQPGLTGRKYSNLGKILDQYLVDNDNFKVDLITNFSMLAEKYNVQLIEIPVVSLDTLHKTTQLHHLTVKGKFGDFLRLLSSTETANHIGHIRSIVMYSDLKEKDNSTEIYIQFYFIGLTSN